VTTAGAAYVVICLSSGLAAAIVAKLKGSSVVLWFLIATILPLIGLAAALAYRFENRELRRRCPNCGKVTKLHDALCTRCGAELDFPDVAIAPESALHKPRYTR
jgi:peptidoglycan/LPS O-acetylase OafA/YrhL